jgi:hypothetical protein
LNNSSDVRYWPLAAKGKMMMKIKISYAVAALVILSLASSAHAQHNHIQSTISGQYDRLIHNSDHSAGVTTRTTENREQQPKPRKNKRVDSSAGPIIERKN